MRILKLVGAVFVAASVTLMLRGGAAAQTPLPPAEAFVAGPTVTSVSISPDGSKLALVSTGAGASHLVVYDLVNGGSRILMESRIDPHFGGAGFDWITWKGSDRLLVAARLLEVERRRGEEDGAITSWRIGRGVLALPVDGSPPVTLQGPRSHPGNPGDLLDILNDDPAHVLMTYRDRSGNLDVARVNIVTGQSEHVLDGQNSVLTYYTDHGGQIIGRLIASGSRGRVRLLEGRDGSGDWQRIAEIRWSEMRDLDDFQFVGATAEPGRLYVIRRPDAQASPDTTAVHIYDLATRDLGPPIFQHALYDVTAIVRDPTTGEFLAGCYRVDVQRCDFQRPALSVHMQALHDYFDGERDLRIVSQTEDGSKWLLYVTGPDEPGGYYLYDREAQSVDLIGDAFPRLRGVALATTRRIDYGARDGQALHGYLTVPRSADGQAPLIVMPHGGPEMRDGLGYQAWVQFLVSRGYAVFQPNFRGSSGFGRAFAEAGYRQWGGVMQTDMDDGVQHLIDAGLATADRVCIVGASYGGYAALQGGAARPDLYRCVISINGLGDLVDIMRWERSTFGSDSPRAEYWERSIGHPSRDRELLEAASPIRAVEGWRPPVLLIHGEEDHIVPVDQSRDMERALRRAGADVRLVVLEGEGHGNWATDTEVQVLTEMDQFLARHLPVR